MRATRYEARRGTPETPDGPARPSVHPRSAKTSKLGESFTTSNRSRARGSYPNERVGSRSALVYAEHPPHVYESGVLFFSLRTHAEDRNFKLDAI